MTPVTGTVIPAWRIPAIAVTGTVTAVTGTVTGRRADRLHAEP